VVVVVVVVVVHPLAHVLLEIDVRLRQRGGGGDDRAATPHMLSVAPSLTLHSVNSLTLPFHALVCHCIGCHCRHRLGASRSWDGGRRERASTVCAEAGPVVQRIAV
jgi:hypothetical protein